MSKLWDFEPDFMIKKIIPIDIIIKEKYLL